MLRLGADGFEDLLAVIARTVLRSRARGDPGPVGELHEEYTVLLGADVRRVKVRP